jgi:hypothetical protein
MTRIMEHYASQGATNCIAFKVAKTDRPPFLNERPPTAYGEGKNRATVRINTSSIPSPSLSWLEHCGRPRPEGDLLRFFKQGAGARYWRRTAQRAAHQPVPDGRRRIVLGDRSMAVRWWSGDPLVRVAIARTGHRSQMPFHHLPGCPGRMSPTRTATTVGVRRMQRMSQDEPALE